MSEPSNSTPIIINSEDDYRAAQIAWREAVVRVIMRANAEGLTQEQTIAARAEVMLPYRRAMSDPANPVAEAIRRQDMLSGYGNRATLLSREDYPELYAERDRQVTILNAINNVEYDAPPIYVITQLRESDGTSLAYTNGMVVIDADFLRSGIPTQSMAGLIGHELSHRYERSDESLRARITVELEDDAGIPNSKIALRVIRDEEAHADLNGARLTSPSAMRDGLHSAAAESTQSRAVAIHFQQTRGIVDDVEAIDLFNNLSPEERDRVYASYNQLPEAQRATIQQRITEDRNALEPDKRHPSIPHRLDMLRMLEAHPEIMACRNIRFDGSANIVEATECPPTSVTNAHPTVQNDRPR